ncbi:MAG TPA: hypothetical protein VKF42_09800, partial [Chitinivibrionales bacterium]|nr:hypothetical protein [Chitinivibrionales bacterium]
ATEFYSVNYFFLRQLVSATNQQGFLFDFSTLQLFNVSTLFLGAPAAEVSFLQINLLGGYPRGGMGADRRRLRILWHLARRRRKPHPRGTHPPPKHYAVIVIGYYFL